MASCMAYIGGGISIIGAIVAAWPALPSNKAIAKKTSMEWSADDKFEEEERRDDMISGRKYAAAGIAIAIIGQVIGLMGT